MKSSYNLAGAEQKIMQALWENGGTLSTGDLLDLLNRQGKPWKRQTLNTLLSRLEAKGVISRPRAYVEALISQKDLLQLQTKEILDSFYGGKLKNFCAALIGDTRLDDSEVKSLNAMIEELQKEQEGKGDK